MNIVVTGAHPDDPESGCAGLAMQAVQQGHRVIFLYFSSGRPGRTVDGRSEAELREAEASAACRMCGAEPHFLRYPVSDIPFDASAVGRACSFMSDVDADLVLGHWPVDTHPDHQAAGALATQAVVGNPDVALAYYEVCTGIQTLAFQPNRYVDISAVAAVKRKTIECHVSQNVAAWLGWDEERERGHFRHAFGMQENGGRAEAYHIVASTPAVATLFPPRDSLRPSGSRTPRKVKHEDVPLYV